MAGLEVQGLTEMQRNLMRLARRTLPREVPKVMRKVGSKARTQVAKRARKEVKKRTGNYHKAWKRGKVFKGHGGDTVVRVYNSSPHAHLLEHGHVMKDKNGNDLGKFVPGRKPMQKGMREFESSGQMEKIITDWLDDLIRKGKL